MLLLWQILHLHKWKKITKDVTGFCSKTISSFLILFIESCTTISTTLDKNWGVQFTFIRPMSPCVIFFFKSIFKKDQAIEIASYFYRKGAFPRILPILRGNKKKVLLWRILVISLKYFIHGCYIYINIIINSEYALVLLIVTDRNVYI